MKKGTNVGHTSYVGIQGHTPNELFQEEKKHSLPAEPFRLGQTDTLEERSHCINLTLQ